MMKRFLVASAAFLVALPALAASPVTINNAANTDSAGVTNHALNVNVTGGTGGTVTANQGTPAAQTLTNAWPVVIPSATTAATSALASNLVLSASAASPISFEVSADSTLSGAAWWIMVFNATSLPSNGAVTPAKCYALPSGATSYSAAFTIPPSFGTGVVIGVSTTGCFTLTASTHAFISGDYR